MQKTILIVVALLACTEWAQSQTAQLQLIHNAADPAAFVVDVYANDVLVADDLTFRTASAVLNVPAGVDNAISIAFKESTSVYDAFATFLVRVPVGRHFAVISGVYQPTEFAANPSAQPIAFTVVPFPSRRDTAAASTVDVFVYHGVTDAPSLNVTAGITPVATGLLYGSYSDYATLSSTGTVDVRVSTSASEVIGEYALDVSSRAGTAIALIASGFLTPATNKNGPAFGLWEVLRAGGPLVPLRPLVASIEDARASSKVTLAPNPASTAVRITLPFPEQSVAVRDLLGRLVLHVVLTAEASQCTLDLSGLPRGNYIVTAGATSAHLQIVE